MMRKTDLTEISGENLAENISESQVPSLIQKQFSQLGMLRKYVDTAMRKAESAQLSAKAAKEKSAGAFRKKAAIESLQDATVDLADAQMSAAEAQEISFKYQQKLGDVTKYLFGLGVSNIAMNRSVVRELEMRLNNASKEELDELARQEILSVVKQLKAQEDILQKQTELSGIVREHDILLEKSMKKNAEQDELLAEGAKRDEVQDEEIARQAEVDAEHDRRLGEREEKDRSQDEELARQAEVDAEHDRRLKEGEEKDRSQDEEIARQAEVDAEHDRRLKEGEEKDRSQDEEIARQAEVDKKHDELIEELMRMNLERENQINELKILCGGLSSRIDDNNAHVENVKGELDSKVDQKAGKTLGIVSLVIAIASLLFSIVQFFI